MKVTVQGVVATKFPPVDYRPWGYPPTLKALGSRQRAGDLDTDMDLSPDYTISCVMDETLDFDELGFSHVSSGEIINFTTTRGVFSMLSIHHVLLNHYNNTSV